MPSDVQLSSGDSVARCVEAAGACAQACTICADACLQEPDVDAMRRCIRLDLDCADLCGVVVRLGDRKSGVDAAVMRAVLDACARACTLTAEECRRHAGHAHCRNCAEAATICAAACQGAAAAFAQR